MNDSPANAATTRPSKMPSVHFQRWLIDCRSREFSVGPGNRGRTIAPRRIPLHSVYILAARSGLASFIGSAAYLGNQLFALLLVTRQSPLDNRDRGVRRPYIFDFHQLAFQLLVVLKESLQYQQPMRRQIPSLHIRAELRIVSSHGNHFIVARARVDHG